MWGKFPSGGPPPPVWETPVIKKKLGLFFILEPQEHLWSSPKNHNSAPEKTIAFGIGGPPPLCWESFPHIPVFSGQVACKIGWEPFWHAKNNLVNRHQEVGLGQTPPPSLGNFPT